MPMLFPVHSIGLLNYRANPVSRKRESVSWRIKQHTYRGKWKINGNQLWIADIDHIDFLVPFPCPYLWFSCSSLYIVSSKIFTLYTPFMANPNPPSSWNSWLYNESSNIGPFWVKRSLKRQQANIVGVFGQTRAWNNYAWCSLWYFHSWVIFLF